MSAHPLLIALLGLPAFHVAAYALVALLDVVLGAPVSARDDAAAKR